MKLPNTLFLAGVATCLNLLAGCSEKEVTLPAVQSQNGKKQEQSTKAPEDTRPIGSATMDEDGTIHLMLRAEGRHKGQEIVGDGKFSYRKGDPDYQKILEHLGGMRPGETKVVPPFPDEGR